MSSERKYTAEREAWEDVASRLSFREASGLAQMTASGLSFQSTTDQPLLKPSIAILEQLRFSSTDSHDVTTTIDQ